MKIEVAEMATLVKLAPGESVHAGVLDAFEKSDGLFSTVVSMIGSLQFVDWGVATCDAQGVPGPGVRKQKSDAIEIGGIQGHVGRDDSGDASLHLHGVMFDSSGNCIGGHIFAAETLITVEFALMGDSALGWFRYFEPVNGSGPLPLFAPRNLRRY